MEQNAPLATPAAATPPVTAKADARPSAAVSISKLISKFTTEQINEGARGGLYDLVINACERPLLETVLRHHDFNQTHVAAALGINRNTLRKRIRLHGLMR